MSDSKPGLSNEEGKPTPGQIGHELRPEDGPFKVEVDDHSDDCGTVYRLFGPSTSILHKDKDYLDEMAEHHNWGWYQAILSVTGQGQEERDRKVFEAGYEAFCTKHYTLDQAWEAFKESK